MLFAGSALAQSTAPAQPATPPAPATPAAPAQPAAPKTDEKLPSGKEVLAKYVEATGGKAAYEKVKTRVSEGTFELKPMGMKGTLKMMQQAPGSMSLSIEIEGMGTIVQGNDGKHAWNSDPMQGARLLDGKELEESNRQAQLAAELYPDIIYKSVECVGIEKIGDVDCYKVEMITKGDSKRTSYYSKADGLLVKLDMTIDSPMGEVKATTTMADYRDVDGMKVAYKAIMAISAGAKIEQVMTFTKITHNTELPASTFNPPKDVQDLIDAAKKDAEKPANKPADKPAAPASADPKKPEEKK
jgi:outer membrane lipoprotein-sorting protein